MLFIGGEVIMLAVGANVYSHLKPEPALNAFAFTLCGV